MKRTFTYALGAVMAAALAVPAFAQDNFPDVPANHWAYEALARMKRDGLLVGYPDGLFRGSRPASRYELAVATHAVYTNLKNITDGLQQQIDALKGAGPQDLTDIRNAISALQSDVAGLKGYGEDIANLKRMADTFDRELRALGVDVEAMKRDLADLADRVARLERRRPAVDISGDVNLVMLAGNSRDDLAGLDKDGRLNGLETTGGPVGLTKDLTILHEGAFTLAGTNETGPKWRGTLVVGNMLGGPGAFPPAGADTAFGTQSTFPGGRYQEAAADVYLQDLSVRFDTSVAGLGFGVEAGRVGYKVSPYLFQRPDTTTYFANERWDDGLYRFDGAILGFNFGGAKLNVFGGKNSRRFTVNRTELNPMIIANNRVPGGLNDSLASSDIDRSLGLNLNVPISTAGSLNLAYLWLENDLGRFSGPLGANLFGVPRANRLTVFGGDVDWAFGRIKLEGGAARNDVQYNTDNAVNTYNNQWHAQLAYQGDRFRVFGGYRVIEANYVAPGDWGRLGILRNPANIKGWQVGANVDLSPGLKISAIGEFDRGNDTVGYSIFNTDTRIDSFTVKLGYNLTSNLGLSVGYENARFRNVTNLAGGFNDPNMRWTTFGIGYGLSPNAKLNIQYEISDHNDLFTGFVPYTNLGPDFRGGLLSTQLTVKF